MGLIDNSYFRSNFFRKALMMKKIYYFVLASALFLGACNGNDSDNSDTTTTANTNNGEPTAIPYSVINVYPHDTAAYTEGLFFHDGDLYESTGGMQTPESPSKSFIVKRTIQDLKPIKQMDLQKGIFGEGINIINGKLYQLTYTEHKVFVYDAKTWAKVGEFNWPREGWAMTNDGKSLIISTGDSNLYYVNPNDFSVEKIVGVTTNMGPLGNINELEYVDGMVYANVFGQNQIVKIDPNSGKVVGVLDLTDINAKNGIKYSPKDAGNDVLNGIAYNPTTKTFFVTGKRWPKIFEIRL
ncbi:MAG: glutamine cyclotransferase [Pseudopedobacter saltans]|uniref:Glutamine cyclotransferase n=1 Tax=Pseudopedobacter saltans TaxID=151895 RepID=A0A2W5F007_9SPHI|nr:MAG: glutamine cyclotransferase [Pseudopedobacter saltans]